MTKKEKIVYSFVSNIIDYGMDPQASLDAARTFYFDGVLECEKGITEGVISQLKNIGHNIQVCDLPHGGGQVIQFNDNFSLVGGSDPRKDGCALGF